jgi:hypothetical protein
MNNNRIRTGQVKIIECTKPNSSVILKMPKLFFKKLMNTIVEIKPG